MSRDEQAAAQGHGTEAAYTHGGCRCDRCRRAATEARKQRRERVPVDERRQMWRDEKRRQRA